MRTALLLCTALVLGWTLPAFSGPVELFTVDERDKLIKQMKTEVSELLEKKQIPTSDGRYAASIVLQSLAIDMNRILETELSEDDWQRYSKGEKGLFVRKMLGMRERSRLAAVAQRYREDSEFREYVNRYIAQFEGALGEAKKRDMDGVLATTFLTADVGKVYMLLIRAIGREN